MILFLLTVLGNSLIRDCLFDIALVSQHFFIHFPITLNEFYLFPPMVMVISLCFTNWFLFIWKLAFFSYLLSHETICRTHQLFGVSKQIQISGQALTMDMDMMHMGMLRTPHMHMVLMLDIASIHNR